MMARDYMLTEWALVPFMPGHALWRRSWGNIVDRATEKFGSDAVRAAIAHDAKLRGLNELFGNDKAPEPKD